jgi:sugar/nucleoside kinase (ribokinase family)
MIQEYDLVVLGDINLDYVVSQNLSLAFSNLTKNGVVCWDEINEIPGGSGLNFCVFAENFGYRSLLLAKIGDDDAGVFIEKWLKQKKISLPLHSRVQSPTGKAIILRDSSDIRLLINNKQNANHLLALDDIDQNSTAIKSSSVLYISGYAISELDVPRYKATLRAMECARSSHKCPVIVFDVVPHRIYEKISFDEFRKQTQNVDILVSEVATIRRFLQLGTKSEIIDDAMAKDTAKQFSHYYGRLILRYGDSGCDNQILVDKSNGRFCCEQTGHALAKDKRGFGDKLTIKALREFFDVLPTDDLDGRVEMGLSG